MAYNVLIAFGDFDDDDGKKIECLVAYLCNVAKATKNLTPNKCVRAKVQLF